MLIKGKETKVFANNMINNNMILTVFYLFPSYYCYLLNHDVKVI